MTAPFALTAVHSLGPLLAKHWCKDGTIADYDRAQQFTVTRHAVASAADLFKLIDAHQHLRGVALIRGVPGKAIAPGQRVARNLLTFTDAPSHLFVVDIDKYVPEGIEVLADPVAAIDQFIEARLPSCFQGVAYTWQLSGSAGHPTKSGQLRAHLYYWLSAPLSCEEAEAWARKWAPAIDSTVHRTVQLNYTANPHVDPGVTDPYAGRRVGYAMGWMGDTLDIPADMPVPDLTEVRRVTRGKRRDMVDPRDKPGVVGALSRAFTPEQITSLHPELFTEGRTPDRITWLAGGGSGEGIRVCDNGTHLFNSHSSSPCAGRAANLWDFLRAHAYGHLDEGLDPEVLEFAPTTAPSYLALQAWALTQPEVQAELTTPEAGEAREAQADARAEKAVQDEP